MIESEYQLIREALVREIRDAKRWSAVVEAWDALLSVGRKAKNLIAEQRHLTGSTSQLGSKRSDLVCPQCKKLPNQCDCPMRAPK